MHDRAPSLNDKSLTVLRKLPDPEILKEPKSRRGNGPVYSVFGRSYRVMDSANGFVQEGTASWYGVKFHGRQTSSGEPFDIYKLTAAHRHLPIPTFVRVTNLDNGRHTIVRVNDRGPFHGDRIIDLSYAAAVKLDFHERGTARVRVEVVEPEPDGPQQYLVQAGAFRDFARADNSQQTLQAMTGLPGMVVKTQDGLYRVQLGPVRKGAETERVEALLLASDFGKPRLLPAPCPNHC